MLKFIKRQINSIKKGGSRAFIVKTKNLPSFLNAFYSRHIDPLWLWSSIRKLTGAFSLNWSFPYFREAKLIYVRKFIPAEKKADLKAIDQIAGGIGTLISKGLEHQPSNYDMLDFLAGIRLFTGKVDEWAKYTKIAFEKREQILNRVLPPELGLRLFTTSSVRSIGFACHWDGLLKARHLGLIPPDKIVMIWNREIPSANRHWMNYLGKYIIFIDEHKNEHKKLIDFFKGIERKASEYIPNPFRIGNRVYVHNHAGLALIEQHWDKEEREPLFKLTPEDIQYGRDQLSSLGVPKDAWFACLHVRAGGYKGNEFFREALIENYLMAIQAVVDRGGWVIRMGDSTMAPLAKMDNVIDYPHSAVYSDRMDIVLCGLSRLFIATSSGLYCVARSFGVPIVQTNYLPTCALFLSKQDIFLPKLARRINDANLLKFSEIMSAPFSFGVHDINYKQLGVELINNTPEEIMEVVEEMMDKLDGKFQVDAKDEALQAKFSNLTTDVETLYGLDKVPINCKIGTHFLRRYQYLLRSN